MIVEVALVSRTAPSQWWDEDDATLATALDVLGKMHKRRR